MIRVLAVWLTIATGILGLAMAVIFAFDTDGWLGALAAVGGATGFCASIYAAARIM